MLLIKTRTVCYVIGTENNKELLKMKILSKQKIENIIKIIFKF